MGEGEGTSMCKDPEVGRGLLNLRLENEICLRNGEWVRGKTGQRPVPTSLDIIL